MEDPLGVRGDFMCDDVDEEDEEESPLEVDPLRGEKSDLRDDARDFFLLLLVVPLSSPSLVEVPTPCCCCCCCDDCC